MADDLGDSHPLSLQQGGRLPDNSDDCRVVGRIFVKQGEQVNLELYPELANESLVVIYNDPNCLAIDSAQGTGTIFDSIVPNYTGWLTVKVKNATASQPGQKCYVKLNYLAPEVVNTTGTKNKCACVTASSSGIQELNESDNLNIFPNPAQDKLSLESSITFTSKSSVRIIDLEGKVLSTTTTEKALMEGIDVRSLVPGMYLLELSDEQFIIRKPFVKNN